MYIKSNFEPSSDVARLWRYCDLAKLLSLVTSRKLFFAHINLLKEIDALEGYSAPLKYPEQYPAMVPIIDSFLKKLALNHFVNCWHMSDFESMAMWKLYGEQYAIQTTFGRLKRAFPENRITAARVQYVDQVTDALTIFTGSANLFHVVIRKDISFSYENEVRLVLIDKVEDLFPVEARESGLPMGVPVLVDLPTLIEAVYISPRLPSWQIGLLEELFSRYELGDIPIRRTRIDELLNPSQ